MSGIYSIVRIKNCITTTKLAEISKTAAEVADLLRNLDVNKALGPDGIPTQVLKESANKLAPSLSHLYLTSHSALAWLPHNGNLHMWSQYTRKATKGMYLIIDQYRCYAFFPKSLNGVYSITSTNTSRWHCKTRNTVL